MKRLITSLLCFTLLGACASAPQSASILEQTPEVFLSPKLVSGVPFFPQELYQCGPAALATVLGSSQVNVSPEELVPLVYVPERQGSFQVELVAAARSYGRLAYQIPPTLEALLTEINAGHPVLVMQNLALDWYPQWHFAVVKGFDLQREIVILNSSIYENYELSLKTFERTWARAEHWALVVVEPGTVPVTAEPVRYFSAVVALEQNNPAELIHPAYSSGLERWPEDRELLMAYANFLYSENDKAAAIMRFERVIELYPDYAPAYNNLAFISHEQGQNELAMQYATRAVELGGVYLDTYLETLRNIQAE